MATNSDFYTAAELRVEYFAATIGAVGAICAALLWGLKPAAGVALGAALSWLNYRWMRLGVATMARLAKAQHGTEKAHVPAGTYLKVAGRYALLILAAYVILKVLKLPIISLLLGFSAVLAGVMVELILQLTRGRECPRTDS